MAAVLDWPKSEPQARRQLSLRAAELAAWLRQELLAPIDRPQFAAADGAADGAPAWRFVLGALGASAARSVQAGARLPRLESGGELATQLEAAVGARHFTPHDSLAALQDDEWLRGARLFTTLLERSPADEAGELAHWLDAAVVFAADLRASALLEPALHAARLEEAVRRRLAGFGDPLDETALHSLRDHALAAHAALPSVGLLADRESRLLQATLCGRAGIPPFQAADRREDESAALPLIATAAAVAELEQYDDLLTGLLITPQSDRARQQFEQYSAALGRVLPQAVPLLADGALLDPVRDARRRLEAIATAAEARLPAVDRAERRQ